MYLLRQLYCAVSHRLMEMGVRWCSGGADAPVE